MARFSPVLCVALLAFAAGSAHSAGVPVYRAGAFQADSDEPAVVANKDIEHKVQEAEESHDDYDYQNEGRSFGGDNAMLAMEEADRTAFFALVEKLLWNHATGEPHEDARGFVHQPERRGLFRMAKPALLEEDFAGRMYEGVLDQCYTSLCKFGLGGLFASLNEMVEAIL